MKHLIVLMMVLGGVWSSPTLCSLQRSFSVFVRVFPSSNNDALLANVMGKVSFNKEVEARCALFIDTFLGDGKTTWDLASDRASIDYECEQQRIWGGIVLLKLLAAASAFYTIYPTGENWQGWNQLGLDLKEAYLTDRVQQCYSIPITLFGLFALYRAIRATLSINGYTKVMVGKVKNWLMQQKETVPTELLKWHATVSRYDDALLEKSIASGDFTASLWAALCGSLIFQEISAEGQPL